MTASHDAKRRILLTTLYGNYNLGNVLQRYALTRTLEDYGFEVTHFCKKPPKHLTEPPIKTWIKLPIKYVLARLGSEKFRLQLLERRREKRFRQFQDKFTPRKIFMTYTEAVNAPKSEWDKYSYAVTGSDQVWHNWSLTPDELRCYYLEFMPREKRVCYAPSFGFTSFTDDDRELHRKGLEGFCRLSCREQEMQPMIRTLTGQEAELVLDPTLLLTRKQWQDVASKPEYNVPERYVLCYFLGEITSEYRQAINDMAGGFPVINVYDNKDMTHYVTHPGELVYLFEHADFVVTDSFHGTAFSVNFGKNFLVFRRVQESFTDMFGRIESILTNTGLMNHVYEPGMSSRPDDFDSESVGEKLGALREKSLKYLRECLKV